MDFETVVHSSSYCHRPWEIFSSPQEIESDRMQVGVAGLGSF